MPTAFISHPVCRQHEIAPGHPEQPARLAAIEDQLHSAGIHPFLQQHMAPPASLKQLQRAHDTLYIESLRQRAPGAGETSRLDPDTAMNHYSWQAALHAAGAGVQGVDLLLSGECQAAFCAVRPPGHHAERDAAMGFCLFNNVAVAAMHALEQHGLKRVAIVDFDVHYGNGTADIFDSDERVLLCSLFQYPLYPLSEPPPERAHFAPLQLAPGQGSMEFRAGVARDWLPAMQAHAPELLLFSAGFDAHAEDPLADLCLSESDYAWVTEQMLAASGLGGRGRCLSMLEGGYDLSALGRSAVAHIRAMDEHG